MLRRGIWIYNSRVWTPGSRSGENKSASLASTLRRVLTSILRKAIVLMGGTRKLSGNLRDGTRTGLESPKSRASSGFHFEGRDSNGTRNVRVPGLGGTEACFYAAVFCSSRAGFPRRFRICPTKFIARFEPSLGPDSAFSQFSLYGHFKILLLSIRVPKSGLLR